MLIDHNLRLLSTIFYIPFKLNIHFLCFIYIYVYINFAFFVCHLDPKWT